MGSWTAVIVACPVWTFLVLLCHYSRFVYNYLHLSSLLTDLIKEGAPGLLWWLKQGQWGGFRSVKVALAPAVAHEECQYMDHLLVSGVTAY